MPASVREFTPEDPFQLLQALERHYLAQPARMNETGPLRQQVAMIGFRTGTLHGLVSLEEIQQILLYPDLTRIPNARFWLKGIANMRGNILPVMDLHGFLSGQAAQMSRAQRVLVIQQAGRYLGLLVDELFGIRRFYTDTLSYATSDIADYYAACVDGKYTDEETGQDWHIFSLSRFRANPLINRATD